MSRDAHDRVGARRAGAPTLRIRRIAALLTALLLAAPAPAVAGGDERPNLLLLLVDDQRDDTLGCAGHPQIRTPNVDRLAREGVRFTQVLVTTPICAASRASILTGRTETGHGFTFGTPPLDPELVRSSYPALLRAAGYRTAWIGKLGVGLPAGAAEELFDVRALRDRPYLRTDADGTQWHVDERNLADALAFLDGVGADRPFCLTVALSSAHAEDGDLEHHYPAIEALRGAYEDVEPLPPRLCDPAIFEAQPAFLRSSMNRIRYHWRWDTPEKYARNMRGYYRLVSGADWILGRLLEALERLELADRTVVVYAADNGYHMGDRGFAGKWTHYEESLRVPLVVYDPRLAPERRGREVGELVLNTDWPVTLLDLAGREAPEGATGRSLVPLLEGRQGDPWRGDAYLEHRMVHRDIPRWEGLREGRWKYARYLDQDPPFEFLHDLARDPDELRNLAGEPGHDEVLERLRARTDELRLLHAR